MPAFCRGILRSHPASGRRKRQRSLWPLQHRVSCSSHCFFLHELSTCGDLSRLIRAHQAIHGQTGHEAPEGWIAATRARSCTDHGRRCGFHHHLDLERAETLRMASHIGMESPPERRHAVSRRAIPQTLWSERSDCATVRYRCCSRPSANAPACRRTTTGPAPDNRRGRSTRSADQRMSD
jgi:hypothetical protein